MTCLYRRAIYRGVDVVRLAPRGTGIAAELVAVRAEQPPHSHAFMELVLVKQGSALHVTHKGTSRITAGAVRIVRPGQWHAYEEPDDLLVWNVYLGAKTLAGELTALRADPLVASLVTGRLSDPPTEPRSGPELALIEPHLWAIAKPPNEEVGDALARLGHLLVVLGHIVPSLLVLGPEPQLRPVHPAVGAATDLLHAHPEARWTLRDLARRVHTSEHYLCRCFTRELGISPLRYLDRHRLELVAQLLLESDLSIMSISEHVGIPDPNYMARRFRAAHGLTPSQYRSTLGKVTHGRPSPNAKTHDKL